ncbi:MAG TPA: twin-arginine translocase TatA/TatE family subunit [Candidatus Dormibacteraeota bacterium]|jgi:sec-independent protein translocase protein TatA
MPFGLHPAYLIILLAIILIIFGPGKLPELGSAVGRGMREFRRAQDGLTNPPPETTRPTETTLEADPTATAPAAAAKTDTKD